MAKVVRKSIKISGACLFLIYLVGLIYFLFFAENYGRGLPELAYSYNLRPFYEIRRYLTYREILGARTVFLNLAGNIIGFMPFGALLPILSKSVRNVWKVGLLSMEISALVELSQFLFQVGCFDVDDIILNTVGGVLGYFVFLFFFRQYFRIMKR
jgi:glycopeptide antibiotics resistance protein